MERLSVRCRDVECTSPNIWLGEKYYEKRLLFVFRRGHPLATVVTAVVIQGYEDQRRTRELMPMVHSPLSVSFLKSFFPWHYSEVPLPSQGPSGLRKTAHIHCIRLISEAVVVAAT